MADLRFNFTETLNNAGLPHAGNRGAMTITGGGSSTGNIQIPDADSSVSFGAGSFLLDGGVNISGPGAVMATGAILTFGDAAGDLVNVTTGRFDWSSGSMKGPGQLQLSTGTSSTWNGSFGNLDGINLSNLGLTTWSAKSFGMLNGAVINNSGTINATGEGLLTGGAAGGTFNNAGTFRKSGGAGQTTISVPFHNTGLVRVDNSGLAITGGGSSTGNIEVTHADSSVSFGAGSFLLDGGVNISGPGAVMATGAILTFGDAAGDLVNVTTGRFDWSSGSMKGPGQLQLSAGTSSTWSGLPGNLDGLRINNSGVVTWGASFGVVNGATINNSGTFNATGDHFIAGTAASGIFSNSGTFRKTGGEGTSTIQVPFHNNGIVQLDSGVLAITNGGTHTGDFRTTGTRVLQFIGGEHHLKTGVDFLGDGGLGQNRLGSSSIFRLAGGATVNVASGARLVIDSALLTGDGGDLLNVSGSLVLGINAVMSGTGTTRINAGGEALFSDGGTKSIEARTFLNEGTTNWTSTSGAINVLAAGRIDNRGTFIVANNSALFGEQGPTPGHFDNSGTLRKIGVTGTSLFNINFTNTATGVIDLQSGRIDFTGGFVNHGSMTVANASSTINYGGIANGLAGTYQVGTNGILTFNIAPGGSLVAQGGGNIVAGGGGNIVAGGGGNLVAQGGGNLVAQGGGNLVAQGGGNLVAQGGGNLVAQGGGNLVAQGGGNVIAQAGGIISGSGLIGMDGGSLIGMDGGSLRPGESPGILTVKGNLDLRAGSILEIEIGGLTVGTHYDRLDVDNGPTGSAVFDGNLLIELLYGFRNTLTAADQFTVLTADTAIGGTIDNLTAGRVTTKDGYGSFAVSYQNGGHDLVLSGFAAVPLTYPLWIKGFAFNAGQEASAADPDRDGMSNGLEYGLGSDPLVANRGAVPEVSLSEAVAGSGVRYLTLTYERPAGVSRPVDLVWSVQRNADPTSAAGWSSAGLTTEQVTPSPGTGLETVMVRSQTAAGTAGLSREFLRLSVAKP